MLFRLSYLISYYLFINRSKSKFFQSVNNSVNIIQCIKIDLAKSVRIFKHPIKFGQASSTGTAMPLLMKQIGMY